MSNVDQQAWPWLTLAPLAGLAVMASLHLALHRTGARSRPMFCLVLGYAAGLAATIIITGLDLRQNEMDGWEWTTLMAGSIISNGAWAFGYFAFVNLNLASLRLRLLRELRDEPAGLSTSVLLERYNAREMLAARLERLTKGGHLLLRDGRYFTGPNPLFRILARIMDGLKIMIRGQPARLGRAATPKK